jgi:hypothetical protein
MRVFKVADVVEGEVLLCGRGKTLGAEIVRIIVGQPTPENPSTTWEVKIDIGQGSAARSVVLPLFPFDGALDPTAPQFIGLDGSVIFFRGRLFFCERPPKGAVEREEVSLRVRKGVYDEDADLASVRAAVANLEAAIELGKTGPRRELIPDDVKLLVWTRDGGACVRCGAKLELHFDHVIPVAKGGGNSAANIQILCQPCNLRKADKISG